MFSIYDPYLYLYGFSIGFNYDEIFASLPTRRKYLCDRFSRKADSVDFVDGHDDDDERFTCNEILSFNLIRFLEFVGKICNLTLERIKVKFDEYKETLKEGKIKNEKERQMEVLVEFGKKIFKMEIKN